MSKRQERLHFEYDAVKQQAYMHDVRRQNDAYIFEKGKTPTFEIITYGCQMNEHDSERLIGMLKEMGYEASTNRETADLIIFNTCCVRENAELKVYGNLGHLKTLKKKNPALKIVVCGCMMQQPHVVEELSRKYPFVSLIFGTHNLYQFPQLLAHTLESDEQMIEVWDGEGEVIEGIPVDRRYGLKAYVNIMFGCNNFCSYCIVPYTRGRERSRTVSDIIDEINDLVAHGTREITLLGQNVNSFGKTLPEPISFADLLRKINTIDGLERIRFMTSHPKDISDDLLVAMSECDKVCEQLHLPIQSGSDRLLMAMNRHYDKAHYEAIVTRARSLMPDIAITTDMIVGFPGETEEDIQETLDLINRVRFDSAFTFLYSPRKGTPAAEYPNQIDEDTKHKHFNILLKRLNALVIEKNKSYKGKTLEVLVEGDSKNKPNQLTGRTRQFVIVNFEGSADLIGKLVTVEITQPKSFSLFGVLKDIIR